jgi:peptidoglycan lytic transglycosylase
MLEVPRDPAVLYNLDEWWVERRLLARKLLDIGDPRTAYRIVRDAVIPPKENNRSEHHFTAGWIALRFLNEPAMALPHFARIAEGTLHQTTLARAGYWQGRAAEALGRHADARAHYQAAARYPAAYYGQLARARLGLPDVGLNPAPEPGAERRAVLAKNDVVRAVAILYAIDQRDLVLSIMIDLADRAYDPGLLAMLGELAARHKDARAMLYLGRGAIARGLPFEYYAFPTVGMPSYSTIGPEADASVVYAIARQESGFNQKIVSTANAMGLMQVTPEAGRYIAKKFGAKYDQKRLLNDPSYNTQFGAAEIGDLLKDYRGSYILSFAGYNAGRGRVRDWVARYGDPRDPKVDPLDWVERIPFSETRNYVQRVMENMQVYRARFGGGSRLLIEADLRRGASAN